MAPTSAVLKPMFVARNSVPRHSAVRLKVRNGIASYFTAPRKRAIELDNSSHKINDRSGRRPSLARNVGSGRAYAAGNAR